MPTSPPVPITPNPFVQWKFKALTRAEKKDKIARAHASLALYLKGYEDSLRFVPGINPKRLHYTIKDKVISHGNDRFTYAPVVKRKPINIGQPEAGKDPQRPTPPPPL